MNFKILPVTTIAGHVEQELLWHFQIAFFIGSFFVSIIQSYINFQIFKIKRYFSFTAPN